MIEQTGGQSTDPLRAWVEAARRGEAWAWDRLHRRYRGLLLLAIREHGVPGPVRGRFDSEDVLQSSFLSAFESLPEHEFRDEPSFRGWLKRIAMNKLQDRLRDHQRDRRDARRETSSSSGVLAPGDTPSVLLERLEVQGRLLDALTRLQEDDQELVCWKTIEKFSFADIARFRGCSESTARRHYAGALRRLRALMDGAV